MTFSLILLYLCIYKSTGAVKFSIDTISDLPVLLNEGKQQLEVLTSNAKAPQYGECWSNAVSQLKVGCRSLTQEMQSALALRLTDCFLQMSGQGLISCPVPRKECLQTLSDREFNAYTEFFTHTQSICYFLQSKLWHEQSEKTIDRLSSTSYKVSKQLMEAEKGQEALLQQQKASLNMQEDMAKSMENSKDTLANMMDELRLSAMQQQVALGSLFEQLTTLQTWAVGELSWFGSVFFYSSAAVLSCLFTSAARTRKARLPILSALTVNYFIERYITSLVNESNEDVNKATLEIQYWVWFFRKISILLCFLILIVVALTYWDYDAINYKILVQIRNQNSELLKRLGCYGDVVDAREEVVVELVTEKEGSVRGSTESRERELSVVRETDESSKRRSRERELSVVRESATPDLLISSAVLSIRSRRSITPALRNDLEHFSGNISESSNPSVRRSTRLQKAFLSPV